MQAISLELESVKNDIFYPGTFEPNKETKISTDIQGKINSVLVDVGSIVRKGQALVQLDNSILKLQLQTVEIQIEGLEADVKRYTVLANADAIQGVQLEKTTLGLKSAKVQRAHFIGANQQNNHCGAFQWYCLQPNSLKKAHSLRQEFRYYK